MKETFFGPGGEIYVSDPGTGCVIGADGFIGKSAGNGAVISASGGRYICKDGLVFDACTGALVACAKDGADDRK